MSTTGRFLLWLPKAPAPGITVFATLTFIESMARAVVVAVIYLQSYHLLQSAQAVSILATVLSIAGLITGICIPLVIRLLTRRWTFTLGAVALAAAACAFWADTIPTQVLGLYLRNSGAACLQVTANLYVLDTIRKQHYVRMDSTRMTYAMVGWTVGPYLGGWLAEHVSPAATYSVSAVFAVLLIAIFWYLRLTDNAIIQPARSPPQNPLRFVMRFVSQPRLRLAWFVAFGRSVFWSGLFIYGPIMMVRGGLGNEASGILLSLANAMLVTALLWGRVAERVGVRPIIAGCFAVMSLILVATGTAGTHAPIVSGALLVLASLFASGLDAVGSVPFYRAVRRSERSQMSAVYRTYIELADLLPSMVYAVLLGFFDVGAVFIASGLFLTIVAATCWRYLPRSL